MKDHRIKQARVVLSVKADEYAVGEGGRYSNFIAGARLLGSSPISVAVGYLTKHLVSCLDIYHGRLPVSRCDEKFGDAFNYLVIILGIYIGEEDLGKVLSFLSGLELLGVSESIIKDMDDPYYISNELEGILQEMHTTRHIIALMDLLLAMETECNIG